MRFYSLLQTALFVLLPILANAEVVVPCVYDAHRRAVSCDGGTSGGETGSMVVRPCIDAAERSWAVIHLGSSPSSFSSVRLEFYAHHWGSEGSCQVAAIGESGPGAPMLDWDIDLSKPVAYVGILEVTTRVFEPYSLDVTEAIQKLQQAGSDIVVFQFYYMAGRSGGSLAISTMENVDFGGARLVFDTTVPNTTSGLNDVKSLYR